MATETETSAFQAIGTYHVWPMTGSNNGSDSGVVKDFSKTGDLTNVTDLIRLEFENWNVPDMGAAEKMAKTIQTKLRARMGEVGVSHGVHKLNRNQSICSSARHSCDTRTLRNM